MWRVILILVGVLLLPGLDLARPQDRKATQTGDPKTPAPELAPDVVLLLKRILLLDLDGDGRISKVEARGKIADNFSFLDTNKDGFLDRAEIQRLAQRLLQGQGSGPPSSPPPPDFDALDANADGRLSRAEMRSSPWLPLFDQVDANRDGLIDRLEFGQWLERRFAPQKK